MSNNDILEEQVQKEIEERTKIMEDPAYDFGKPFNRIDFLGIGVVTIICIVGIVWGYL
ncbi:hypothetical protein [Natribacillus halophilus]|uniref:Uncharacterized protein n=1 Tax=Natribacillus halophilus TaxID=549003 RepID=A0A1G8SXL6_9BACI|nr:hypothetical protein [Natribacillus halophilus]SDJ33924.1 hypothetical protein SAMN04488123_1395 [Natribacillus halophilus]